MSVPGNVVYSISTYLEDNVHEMLERVSLTICEGSSYRVKSSIYNN